MGNRIGGRRKSGVEERFTRPQGLYEHKDIDQKKLRKLILEAKLAPCYPGADDAAAGGGDLEECPICFLVSTRGEISPHPLTPPSLSLSPAFPLARISAAASAATRVRPTTGDLDGGGGASAGDYRLGLLAVDSVRFPCAVATILLLGGELDERARGSRCCSGTS